MLDVTSTPEVIEAPAFLNPEPQAETPKARKRKPRKAHRYIVVNKLDRTVGIEVSYVPAYLDYADRSRVNDVCRALAPVFKARLERDKAAFNKCGTDPDCIEISTKPIQSRTNLRRTLGKYYTHADIMGLVSTTEWHGGGGAHVHVGRKRGEDKGHIFIQTLYADLSTRPYLTWAFMNPGDDNNNAAPICTTFARCGQAGSKREETESLSRYIDTLREERATYDRKRQRPTRGRLECMTREFVQMRKRLLRLRKELAALEANKPDPRAEMARILPGTGLGKHNAVALRDYGRHGTLEFRLFRAPGTAEGHEAHVNFALAYIEYVEGLVRDGKMPNPVTMSEEGLRKTWTPELAEQAFRKTLRTLGLPMRDYRDDIANIHKYVSIQRDKYGADAYTLSGVTLAAAPAPYVSRVRECRYSPAEIENRKRDSRAKRKQRRERAARLRLRYANGKPAYMLPAEVVLEVGDTIRYGYMDGPLRQATITHAYPERNEEHPARDDRAVYWSMDGDKCDEGYTLLEVNGIPVLPADQPQPEPIMHPTTLAECEGAYIDRETTVDPNNLDIKVGDIIVMQQRIRHQGTDHGSQRREEMRVTGVCGATFEARAVAYSGTWQSTGYVDRRTGIWDSAAWVVSVNGRRVMGR